MATFLLMNGYPVLASDYNNYPEARLKMTQVLPSYTRTNVVLLAQRRAYALMRSRLRPRLHACVRMAATTRRLHDLTTPSCITRPSIARLYSGPKNNSYTTVPSRSWCKSWVSVELVPQVRGGPYKSDLASAPALSAPYNPQHSSR